MNVARLATLSGRDCHANQTGDFYCAWLGSQRPNFADATIKKLTAELANADVDISKLNWQTGYWADVIQPVEDKLWDGVSQNNDLSYVKLRQFVISALGDATAYQLVEGEQLEIYQAIHDRIHDDLLKLRTNLGGDFPFLVLAHSLGGHIMSNYIWDRQQGADAAKYGQTSFERMETLTGLVTFGCNIPLFTLAYKKVVSIRFPPNALPQNLKRVAKWNNYFDPDDILGYPLKPLSQSYNQAVNADVGINVGGLLTSWNPIATMLTGRMMTFLIRCRHKYAKCCWLENVIILIYRHATNLASAKGQRLSDIRGQALGQIFRGLSVPWQTGQAGDHTDCDNCEAFEIRCRRITKSPLGDKRQHHFIFDLDKREDSLDA